METGLKLGIQDKGIEGLRVNYDSEGSGKRITAEISYKKRKKAKQTEYGSFGVIFGQVVIALARKVA